MGGAAVNLGAASLAEVLWCEDARQPAVQRGLIFEDGRKVGAGLQGP